MGKGYGQSRARQEGVGSHKPHNPIEAHSLGFGRMRTPGMAGQIAGQKDGKERVPHARRSNTDGTCSYPAGHPGHRIGAKRED